MIKQELYSKEVEQSILANILIFEDCRRYLKILSEKDFYLQIHKQCFELMYELENKRETITLVSVKELAKSKKMNEKDIYKYLISISDLAITSSNTEYYIKQLKNYSVRREIEAEAQGIISQMYELNSSIEATDIKKEAIKKLSSIKTEYLNTKEDDMLSVMTETFTRLEETYQKRNDNTYHTGFFDLDNIIDGLHKQELTVIAARPGTGKTAFALEIAEHIAQKGIYTYFVSLEMSKNQLGNRLIAAKSEIDGHKLRMGWLEEKDWQKIATTSTELSSLKMFIDTSSTTIQEIENRAFTLKDTKNIGLVIIDYLQLLKSKEKFNIREQEVADISRRLKLLSRDLDIPVIALCQLNREAEKRTRPILADLRESGAIEQDADNIIFLYADDEEKLNQIAMKIQVIVAKQRNGPTRRNTIAI